VGHAETRSQEKSFKIFLLFIDQPLWENAKRKFAFSISLLLNASHFPRYYNRITHAAQDPDNVMSCIMDGMAQSHCSIPWEANQHSFGRPLKQHLQGVLEHHKIFVSHFVASLKVPTISSF
jgi:hypothetical protein